MSQFFNNQVFIEPSADCVVNFASSPAVSALSSSTVLLLGESELGLSYKDKKVYEFSSVADARQILGGGKALDLCQLIFAPSGQSKGASKILFVRTNEGHPAEAKFSASSATCHSLVYTITTQVGSTPSGQVGFKLGINGSDKTEYVADIPSGGTVKQGLKALKSQLDKIVGVSVTLDDTTDKITVTGLNGSVDLSNASDAIIPVNTTVTFTVPTDELVFVSGVTVITKDKGKILDWSCKSSDGIVSFYKAGNIIGVVEGISTATVLKDAIANHPVLSKYLDVEIESGSASTSIPSMTGVFPFFVQPNTPCTPASFAEALSLTAAMPKSAVCCDQEGEAYQIMVSGYADSESETECIAWIGGALGQSPAEAKTAAATFNSERVVYAYPGVYLNLDGETKLYPPTYFAALGAGLMAGLPCEQPLTRKSVKVLGFEEIDYEGNSEKSTREALLNSGVFFGYYTEANGYNILKGINTIQNQNSRTVLGTDNRSHEISVTRIRQQMQKEVRNSADAVFPGTTRLHPSKSDVEMFIANYLNSKVGTYLTGWDDNSLSVTLNDDAWFCTVQGYINSPVNYAFFTINLSI